MSKFKTMLKLVKTPKKMIIPLADNGVLNWIPDEAYLRLAFYCQMGKPLDLNKPKTFSEKLQWLKLHDRKELYHTLVDKYEVKEYVASIIGPEYIVPTLGVWNDPDEIKIEELPDQFVLKCTHDSGSVVICRDKSTFDKKEAMQRLKKHANKSIFWFGREWPYKGIKPRIIAEEYLGGGDKGLNDYKVLCFHGIPKLIEVHEGRMTANHTQDFYTTKWERTEIAQENEPRSDNPINPPDQLELILDLSSRLAKDFIHIRIDWYIANNKLYFGEITFYDGSGFCAFTNERFDVEIGNWIHLPIDLK